MSERPENGCPPPPPPPPSEQPSAVEPQAGASSSPSAAPVAHPSINSFTPRPPAASGLVSANPPMPPLPPPPPSSSEDLFSVIAPKKVMCRDYIRGLCSRGDRCKYSHVYDPSQLKGILNFCHDYQNKGTCEWSPRCKYIHASIAEQRVFNRSGEFPEAVRERNHMFHPTSDGASMVETALGAHMIIRPSELDTSFITQPPPPPPPPPATPPAGPSTSQAATPSHQLGPPPVTPTSQLPPHRNEHFYNTGPMWDPRFPPPSTPPRVPPPNCNYNQGERVNEGMLQTTLQPRAVPSGQYQTITLKKPENNWPQMSLKVVEESSKRSWSDVEDASSPVQPNLKKYKVEYAAPCSNCGLLENSLKTAYSLINELEKSLETERYENKNFKDQICDILAVKVAENNTSPLPSTRSSRSPVQMPPPLQPLRQQMSQLPPQKEQNMQPMYPMMQMAMSANNVLVTQRRMTEQGTSSQTMYARAGPSHAGPSHAGPSHAGPSHAGPSHSGPSHAGPPQIAHHLANYTPHAVLGTTSLSLVQQQRLEALFTHSRSSANYGNPEMVSNGVGSSNMQQFLLQGQQILPQAQTMQQIQPQGQQMQLQGQHIQLQGQAMQHQGALMPPQGQNMPPPSHQFQHQQQPVQQLSQQPGQQLGQQPSQGPHIQAQGQINYNMSNMSHMRQ